MAFWNTTTMEVAQLDQEQPEGRQPMLVVEHRWFNRLCLAGELEDPRKPTSWPPFDLTTKGVARELRIFYVGMITFISSAAKYLC